MKPIALVIFFSILMLVPGAIFSPQQASATIEDNLYKFDEGFYNKINTLQSSSGPSGASGQTQYYNVVLITTDKESLITDLESNYNAQNIFNPENLNIVVTADIPIDQIPSLVLNENIVKIGDGLAEQVSARINYNPNDSSHISMSEAKTFHSLTSDVTLTGKNISNSS